MFKGFARRQLSGGMFLGPLLVGIAYGLVLHLLPGFRLDFLYLQSPFMFSALGGIAMAFACRPVLLRVAWSRPVAAGLGVALVAGLGPFGDWLVSWAIDRAGLGAFPLNLPESGVALLAASVVAGLLMGQLFHPQGGSIDGADLWARWRFHPWGHRLVRLAGVAAAAVVLWLVLAAFDAAREEAATVLYVPMVEPNYWLRLQGLWRGAEGAAGVGALLALLWVRAVLLLVPLLPIAMAVRGSWGQLALVFTILLFVVGDFAPLMTDQPYPSLVWLLQRTALGLVRAALLGGLMAAVFGVIRRPEQTEPPTSQA